MNIEDEFETAISVVNSLKSLDRAEISSAIEELSLLSEQDFKYRVQTYFYKNQKSRLHTYTSIYQNWLENNDSTLNFIISFGLTQAIVAYCFSFIDFDNTGDSKRLVTECNKIASLYKNKNYYNELINLIDLCINSICQLDDCGLCVDLQKVFRGLKICCAK